MSLWVRVIAAHRHHNPKIELAPLIASSSSSSSSSCCCSLRLGLFHWCYCFLFPSSVAAADAAAATAIMEDLGDRRETSWMLHTIWINNEQIKSKNYNRLKILFVLCVCVWVFWGSNYKELRNSHSKANTLAVLLPPLLLLLLLPTLIFAVTLLLEEGKKANLSCCCWPSALKHKKKTITKKKRKWLLFKRERETRTSIRRFEKRPFTVRRDKIRRETQLSTAASANVIETAIEFKRINTKANYVITNCFILNTHSHHARVICFIYQHHHEPSISRLS